MTAMDHLDILRLLPHRYPFLLVDRVRELEPTGGRSASRTSRSTSRSSKVTFQDGPLCPAC